jgi:vacuolar-type H+-ATPase subunit I/STV1
MLRDDFYDTTPEIQHIEVADYDADAVHNKSLELYPDPISEEEQYIADTPKPQQYSERNDKMARLAAGLGDLGIAAAEIFGRSKGALIPKRNSSAMSEVSKKLDAIRKLSASEMTAWQKGLAESRRRDITNLQKINQERAKYEEDERKAHDKHKIEVEKFNANADNNWALNQERQDRYDARNQENNRTRIEISKNNKKNSAQKDKPGVVTLEYGDYKVSIPYSAGNTRSSVISALFQQLFREINGKNYDPEKDISINKELYIYSHWDEFLKMYNKHGE